MNAPPTPPPLADLLATARRAQRRRHLLWVLFAAAVVAGLWPMLPERGGSKGAPRIEYVGAPVTRGDLTIRVSATGTLQPLTQVDVGSELSGLLAEVLVDFNDTVSRGQLLARLDTQSLEALTVQARGSLASAEAREREAEATVVESVLKRDRCAKLAKRQMCSTDELDALNAARARAEAAVASNQAQVAVAAATLRQRETDLAKAAIRSPIDGIVLKRLVEPGQTVAAMMQTPVLFTLAENLTQMELVVAIDEADVGKVRPNQAASFQVDAYPDRTFEARVKQVRYAPETVDGVVTYATVLEVDNGDLALRPGMTATAEVVVEEIVDALLVPNAALRFAPPPAPDAERGGGLLGRLMMRWPSSRPSTRTDDSGVGRSRVWVLEGGAPRPLVVTAGATDDVHTVIVEGDLREGTEVAVDYVERAP